jgi:mono/diheme cytochrome c family protein
VLGVLALAAGFAGWVCWRNVAGEEPLGSETALAAAADPATLERGAYLARAGNCEGCHTRRGGARDAGGRAIATPTATGREPPPLPRSRRRVSRSGTDQHQARCAAVSRIKPRS